MIRLATTADSSKLLAIYAQYIDTAITFEYALPTQQEFSKRIATVREVYPYLVWEEEGRITGYAYAHRYQEREAYQWNAELSVYIDRDCTAKGLGRRLYHCLMELLQLQGIRTVYGIVTIPNENSERLHESMGFRRLGTYRNTGYKCGRWRDVALFEKQIGPCGEDPVPILPLHRVAKETVDGVLQKHS